MSAPKRTCSSNWSKFAIAPRSPRSKRRVWSLPQATCNSSWSIWSSSSKRQPFLWTKTDSWFLPKRSKYAFLIAISMVSLSSTFNTLKPTFCFSFRHPILSLCLLLHVAGAIGPKDTRDGSKQDNLGRGCFGSFLHLEGGLDSGLERCVEIYRSLLWTVTRKSAWGWQLWVEEQTIWRCKFLCLAPREPYGTIHNQIVVSLRLEPNWL